ncbi:MAG: glycosyltransferase family 4 protein [Sphingobacteriaceae bacterium]|nr:glycosyltransferase family 4 protein [Sphingobacteriaceae bacterium]
MNLLVIVQDYPDESDNQRFGYVHTRNKYYVEIGIDVLVLAFDAKKEYVFENITITNLRFFKRNYDIGMFDAIVSHAPNLRNHLRFLYFYTKSKKIFFFVHGHEVLKQSNYYPEPFPFIRSKLFYLARIFRDIYDAIKLAAFKKYFTKNLKSERVKLIFVSEWMKSEFKSNIKIDDNLLENNSLIIHNAAAKEFLNQDYNYAAEEKFKIITIRQFDNPKYAIDLVLKAANENPQFEFHVFGKGIFFKYYSIPDNLKIFNSYFIHQEIPGLLNQYTAAFMPTRLDSQGVMMCEMATFGIPLITSDIPICREMLKEFSNVFFIKNDTDHIFFDDILEKINPNSRINKDKFSFENTILKEVKFFHKVLFNTDSIVNKK